MGRARRAHVIVASGEDAPPATWAAAIDVGASQVLRLPAQEHDLVRELAERQIPLDVCPGSNVLLGRYPDRTSHPLDALRQRTHNRLSPEALQQMLTSFGFKPHQNVFVQYVEYLKKALR